MEATIMSLYISLFFYAIFDSIEKISESSESLDFISPNF